MEIVKLTQYRPIIEPGSIEPFVNPNHRGASMLRAMCRDPARAFTRYELMAIGGFNAAACGGPLCAITAFHWWIMRINDRLPRTGWRIAEGVSSYFLTKIAPDHADRLRRKLNGAVA